MSKIDAYKQLPVLLMGDFNLITSTSMPLIDITGSESIPNPRNSKKIELLIRAGELIDIFQNKNGNTHQYSYLGFNKASIQKKSNI